MEERYVILKDNEVVDVGVTVYSSNVVGNYLNLAFVGYESDGGAFERLVYQALGAAVEAQTVGSTGGLLAAFDYGLEGLIGELFGAEDDWLGSYEKTWDVESDWGIGRYADIVCREKDGTPGLRLWFTIESPNWSRTRVETTAAAPALAPQQVILEDKFNIAPLDEESFSVKYPDGHMPHFPFNEYGYYCSEPFLLDENDTVGVFLEANAHIGVENSSCDYEDGVVAIIFRRISSGVIKSNAANVVSCVVENLGDSWQATVLFKVKETGSYQVAIMNKSGESISCEYEIYLSD